MGMDMLTTCGGGGFGVIWWDGQAICIAGFAITACLFIFFFWLFEF
jgi:hypothetical protein